VKKLLVILLIAFTCMAYGSGFCEGWAAGYSAGYCYGKGYGCVKPVTPVCPVARVGEDTYQDGYNRGFLAGLHNQR
jgi:hypothetical protein